MNNSPILEKALFKEGRDHDRGSWPFLFFGAYVDKVIGSKEVLLSPWALPNRKKLDDYALGARVPSPDGHM